MRSEIPFELGVLEDAAQRAAIEARNALAGPIANSSGGESRAITRASMPFPVSGIAS